jgi:PLP dependent protein
LESGRKPHIIKFNYIPKHVEKYRIGHFLSKKKMLICHCIDKSLKGFFVSHISQNVIRILKDMPDNVKVVAAAKSRNIDEVRETIEAGITMIGENYLQDAKEIISGLKDMASWHFIGHVQKNKVKHIVPMFDMIETVDSKELALLIDQAAERHGKPMPLLIEVNSGHEEQKAGAMPEEVPGLAEYINSLTNVRLKGLMTMGPFIDDPQGLRPYFRLTKSLFDELAKSGLPNVEMKWLSMGMSDSYLIAIDEGANLVRLGTLIYGPRPAKTY